MTEPTRPSCLVRPYVLTLAFYALLGWLYVAFVAVVDPRLLSEPLNQSLAVRKDTFGALCFAASAVAYFLSGILCPPGREHSGDLEHLDREVRHGHSPFFGAFSAAPWLFPGSAWVALLRTAFLYASLGWVYIALNSVSHPYTLSLPLTHLASWPREGAFGLACFVVSLAAYLALQILVTTQRGFLRSAAVSADPSDPAGRSGRA